MEHSQITKNTTHCDQMNIDTSNLERNIELYDKALGLKEVAYRIEAPDGSFIIVYLGECNKSNEDDKGNESKCEKGNEGNKGNESKCEKGNEGNKGNESKCEKGNEDNVWNVIEQKGKRENTSSSRLELTWLRTHANKPYKLGKNETHICVRVPGDYKKTREYHRAMGCLCYEKEAMGLYFIHDSYDYWIEMLQPK